MNRRGFLSIFSAAGAAVAVGAHAAPASVQVQKIESPIRTSPGRYSIGNGELSVEWNWMRDGWGVSSRDGVQWYDDGPLDKGGRTLILEHFGLHDVAGQLPIEVIADMSPAQLFDLRRQREKVCGLACKNDMVSDRAGGRISAEHCA